MNLSVIHEITQIFLNLFSTHYVILLIYVQSRIQEHWNNKIDRGILSNTSDIASLDLHVYLLLFLFCFQLWEL